jgi:hypothetical protein
MYTIYIYQVFYFHFLKNSIRLMTGNLIRHGLKIIKIDFSLLYYSGTINISIIINMG